MRRASTLGIALALRLALGPPAVAAPVASPLPAPSGPFAVGRTHVEWTDRSRADLADPNAHRVIAAWIWYPAATTETSPAPWMPGLWADHFWSDFLGHRPPGSGASLAAVRALATHARDEAPMLAGTDRYPVVLFAPGLGATPLEYASLTEDLASHGYVVVGIVPTYVARFTVLEDGRVLDGRDVGSIATTKAARPTTEIALRQFAEVVDLVRGDLSFALDEVTQANATAASPFHGRLDLTRVGALGHSLGGAAALAATHDDARLGGVVDLDGSPIWTATSPLAKPLLVLSAASTPLSYEAALVGAAPGIHLRIRGTVHTFSNDLRVMPLLPGSPAAGAIDPARGLVITGAYTAAFFDQYLRGGPGALLRGPSSDYPEVTFERGPAHP